MLPGMWAALLRAIAPWSAVASLVGLALTSAELGKSRAEGGAARPAPAPPAAQPTPSPRPNPDVYTGAVRNPPAEAATACPAGMLPVEGNYCPEVEQRCLRYLDGGGGRFGDFRCAEYAPSRCLSPKRRPMHFCIDEWEHASDGGSLPDNDVSLRKAERLCAAEGKRVCRESEWNFACEGEEMRPYPYGFSRDSSACNADHGDLVGPDGKLRDQRAARGAHPRCESPFGVHDLSGNLEEMVARDGPGPTRLAMKGAYWQPSKNHCRAGQYVHDPHYHGTETGFRCCADLPGQ